MERGETKEVVWTWCAVWFAGASMACATWKQRLDAITWVRGGREFPPKRTVGMDSGRGRAAGSTWGARAWYDGGGTGVPWRALERAASALNLAIAKTTTTKPHVEKETKVRKRARAHARGATTRTERHANKDKTPPQYLALPVDAYATLDDRWIQRVDQSTVPSLEVEPRDGDDGNAAFVLQVPMDLLTGISLRPRIWIVTQRKENSVQLSSNRAIVGDDRLDACFDLELDATIRWTEANGNKKKEANNHASALEDVHANCEGAWEMEARVAVGFDVPQALLFMPRVALGSAGSLVMRAVLKAMLPRFLDLLVSDYQSWAEGNTTRMSANGELVPLDNCKIITTEGDKPEMGGSDASGAMPRTEIVGE